MTTPFEVFVHHVLAFSGAFLSGCEAGGPIKSMVQLLEDPPGSMPAYTRWLVKQRHAVDCAIADRMIAARDGDAPEMIQHARDRAFIRFSEQASLARVLDVCHRFMPHSPVDH